MRPAQFTLHEFVALFSRRWKFLAIPVVVVSILCTIGAFLLPHKYESTTTILVEREEILNPLVNYTLALTMASEDRLATFNEIVFSTKIVQTLIDSLELGENVRNEADHQELTKQVKKNIETDRHGSESFTIGYVDTDPLRAQRAATLLADLFIQAKLNVENEKNERAVEFFERKLEEFRQKFELIQNALVAQMKQRADDLPSEDKSQYVKMEHLEQQLNDIDAKIKNYELALSVLRAYSKTSNLAANKQPVFDLQRRDLPYVAELRTSLAKYDDVTARYTAKYPEVEKLEVQIIEVLHRMQIACDSEVTMQQSKRAEVERTRLEIVDKIKQSSIAQRIDKDKESSYDIYKQLYDDMKLKLEQARITRDLGSRGASQYTVIDPAIVPTEASKPNRKLIILGGIALGFVLGFAMTILAELLDTTVRTPRDIELFEKPVIALIPEGFTDVKTE